ncbi:MAG: tetratricopeptide repeat protein, partial [Kiritimatiellales bacterium]
AKMYFLGLGGLPKDEVEAVDLYRTSAEQGSVGAQYELALLYETGTAVETNRAQAEFWFEKAAEKGHAGAQYRLAELKFAEACRRQDAAEAFAENTDVRMHNTGQYKALLSAALEWCRQAADSGNPDAQYLLGRLYASGEGVPRNYDEALHCYEMSAAGKNADAMFYLGMMYHAGLGVPKNPDRAVTLYRQAASAGSRGAMFYLANLYRFGRDIEKNSEKGRDTYRKKALAGVNLPVENLLQLKDRWILRAALEYGIIQWQDAETDEQKSRARAWVSLAAASGISGARDVLIGMAPYGEPSSAISETTVNPAADAVEKKRDASILFPCIEEEHRKIYPDFQVLRVLAAVTERGSSMDITGDQPWGLVVEYQSPVIAGSVGLNGVLQIGIEFENVKTGEPYWSFSRIPDEHTVSREDIKTEVSAYFKLSRYPGLRLKGWRVEYGHLFDDGRFVGILDERHKSGTPGTLEEMAFRNRTAEQLPVTVMVTTDLSGINMSAESTEATVDDSE